MLRIPRCHSGLSHVKLRSLISDDAVNRVDGFLADRYPHGLSTYLGRLTMPLRFEFELDDEDLAYFQKVIEERKHGHQDVEIQDIVTATRELIEGARANHTPRTVMQMLEQLQPMVAMVTDSEWSLPTDDIRRVLTALAYLADTDDLIPDDVPGLGYLDDAVMVELACQSLRPEVHAYRDFCQFRTAEIERRRAAGEEDSPVSRLDWLGSRRKELQEQMRRKRSMFQRLG